MLKSVWLLGFISRPYFTSVTSGLSLSLRNFLNLFPIQYACMFFRLLSLGVLIFSLSIECPAKAKLTDYIGQVIEASSGGAMPEPMGETGQMMGLLTQHSLVAVHSERYIQYHFKSVDLYELSYSWYVVFTRFGLHVFIDISVPTFLAILCSNSVCVLLYAHPCSYLVIKQGLNLHLRHISESLSEGIHLLHQNS